MIKYNCANNIINTNTIENTNSIKKNNTINTNIINKLLQLINKNKYDESKLNKIKYELLMNLINNKAKYELIINLDNVNKKNNIINNKIEIKDFALLKCVENKKINNLYFQQIYDLIIREKIKMNYLKINLANYWIEELFGKIENNNISYYIDNDNLVINLNDKSFIIMCGINQSCYTNENIFCPSNIIYKSSNSSGTIIRQNLNGNVKDIYKESNGVLVTNDIKIGLIKPESDILWKVGTINGMKKNCIIKLRLLESSNFIRPIDLEYIFRGKCRCDSALVEEIQEYNFEKEIPLNDVVGVGIKGFTYKVGEIVFPDKWNDDINISCTNGIHVIEKRENLKKFMDGLSFNMDDILNYYINDSDDNYDSDDMYDL